LSHPAASWLSVGAETLEARVYSQRHDDTDCDVLIVGSGYGGAVAAARLAGTQLAGEAGSRRPARIWVLERGREYLRGMFPTRWSELPGHVRFSRQDGRPARGYAEALFDVRIGSDAHVLLGNGLGGGSLINAGVMAQPDAAVWESGWPDSLHRAAVAAGYEKALHMLGPQRPPEHLPKYQVLQRMATAAGDTAERCGVAANFGGAADSAAGVELQPCTLCGDCLIGCNQGAKGTLDTNYLALAARRGAELFCGATVTRLQEPPARGLPWQVHWHHTEPALRPPGEPALVVRARQVVLAAGALGSTEILLRSREAGLSCSQRLGERFSTNGDMVAAVARHGPRVHASAEQESDPADAAARGVGPTIAGLVRAQANGLPLVAEEFAVPGALRRLFGEIVTTFGVLGLDDVTPPEGEDLLAADGQALDHAGLYGLMGDDSAAGRIELPPPAGGTAAVDAAVRIAWPGLDQLPLFDAQLQWLQAACEIGADAVGGHVIPNPLWRPFGAELDVLRGAAGIGAPLTVHPLGGCPMGDSVDDGVVDAAGRVFRADGTLHDGLAVLDGAIVPRALGINPALTIAALAEQAVAVLGPAWGLQPAGGAERPLPPRPVWAGRRPLPQRPTAVRIRESMQGRLQLQGRFYWARLDLVFADIDDLPALLRAAQRQVPLAKARLSLQRAAADSDEFSARETAPPVLQARLGGHVELFAANDETSARALHYRLQVFAIERDDDALLVPGIELRGTKEIATGKGSLLRQMSELRLDFGANIGAGLLRLDLDDLARRREPLLTVQRQSSAPDALADLGGLAALLLRIALRGHVTALLPYADYDDRRIACNLKQRLPGALPGGQTPQVQPLGLHGARLSRYAADRPQGRPVLLIHGYGASGSTFAHASIPVPLAQYLVQQGRDAWVLDLRTSIGNEPALPGQPRGGPWSFDEVARQDIPAALDAVAAAHPGQAVDVVAHCIGAAMFCIAALDVPSVAPRIGAAVLSQVGPLLRMSPANRLRGYLASYLEQFIGAEEFDVRADFERGIDAGGALCWQRREGVSLVALDMLLTQLPLPEGELQREKELVKRLGVDFRTVRRRSDAIWGHLMEFDNVADDTWKHLDAINGWVKVRSLAQTIHYARHGLLTDASGRNRSLRQELLATRLGFPLLLLHGQRNRVFDWRGSVASFELLCRLRAGDPSAAPQRNGELLRWGGDGLLQLHLHARYGHQDCIVGKDAARDIFAPMFEFLQRAASATKAPAPAPQPLPISFELPWIGPIGGALRRSADAQRWLLRLLVHPHPRRARCIGIVLVPLDRLSGQPQWRQARGLVPPRARPPRQIGAPQDAAVDAGDALLSGALQVALRADRVPAQFDAFVVLTVHSDLLLDAADVFDRAAAPALEIAGAVPYRHATPARDWLDDGLPLHAAALQRLDEAGAALDAASAWSTALWRLPAHVVAAADGTGRSPLRFALGSCQYPPGLMDAPAAGASWQRLVALCAGPQSPQFLLALGDQVYVDATAGVFDPAAAGRPGDAVRKAYELNWRLPPMRAATACLPLYPMLDDHEVRDNWQLRPGQPLDDEAGWALAGYAAHQQALAPPPLLAAGRHYAFEPAGALLLVLDTRSQREPRRISPAAPGVDLAQAGLLPDAALHAALDRLRRADPLAVKFVATASPLLPLQRLPAGRDAERLRCDNGSGYPRTLFELLDFIRREHIRHVVLLSGDAHGSAVCTLQLDGGPAVHAVMSSGLYAPWPFANARAEELLLDGEVELAHGTGVLRGRMQPGAWSARDGFALIEVQGRSEAAHERLHVALCAADGSRIDCRRDLLDAQAGWQVERSAAPSEEPIR
jgi:choline dehydrogenase-like flavoprotein